MTARTADMTAEEFDLMVETDASQLFDGSLPIERPNQETKRVNIDFPAWMVADLDAEASRLAVNRQAVVKELVDEGLALRRTRRRSVA